MSLVVRVAGGTQAGIRTVKAAVKHSWGCPGCSKTNKYFWKRCPSCGHERPW